MAKLRTYIHSSNSKEMMEYYEKKIGAKIVTRKPFMHEMWLKKYGQDLSNEEIENTTMHGVLDIFGEIVYLSDAKLEGNVSGDYTLVFEFDKNNEEEVALANKFYDELSGEGNVLVPLAEQFWGDIFGMFTDKYGVSWQINVTTLN